MKFTTISCAYVTILCLMTAIQPGFAQSLDPILQKIEQSKSLVIGHRRASMPFSFLVTDDFGREHGAPGQILGYSIDLCQAVAASLREMLNLPDLRIEYREITPFNHMDYLERGDVDIVCGATTNTLKRRERVAFSILTFATGLEFLVHDDTGISSPSDLDGKRVGLVKGTTTHHAVMRGIERRGYSTEIVFFEDHASGLAALESKDISAYIGDRILLVHLMNKAKQPEKLSLFNRLYTFEPYALMVRRDSPGFLLFVDRTLAELYRSRKILPIFDKWFGDMGLLANEMMVRALFKLQALPEGN